MGAPVPTDPTFTPTVLPVTAAGGGTFTGNFGVLYPGDIVSEVWVNLQTTVANSDTAEQISLTLTNELGQVLVGPITIPGNCQSASSTLNIFTFITVLPLVYRAAIKGRTLTLSVTASANGAITGHVSLGVRRNMRPYDNWRT